MNEEEEFKKDVKEMLGLLREILACEQRIERHVKWIGENVKTTCDRAAEISENTERY